jgi:hypothetical protein
MLNEQAKVNINELDIQLNSDKNVAVKKLMQDYWQKRQ